MEQYIGTGGLSGLGGMSIEWVLLIVIAVVGFIVQARLQSVFRKYSGMPFPGGLTGREVAEKMLKDNGISNVTVVATRGTLTDNFNPGNMTLNLSEGVYGSSSVAAAAVAAHECGHAVQHAAGYGPIRLRAALVPVINLTSRWAFLVILGGIAMVNMSNSWTLYWVGIGMIAASALFSLVTLPVELNASARAMEWLRTSRSLSDQQLAGARTSLSWAASTYLVAALGAVVTLFYYLAIARNRN